MRKVKIIKSTYADNYYESGTSIFYPCTEDWEEVDDNEYEEIKEAIYHANSKRTDNHWFILIEYSEDVKLEAFKKAADFVEAQRKEKEAIEKRKADAKKKREEKALERKRKQLERLKRELEE